MEKLKQIPAAPKRLICFLLALICMLGLLPNTAFAAGPNTIVMEDCTHNGVYYESAALSTCWLHQMKFDFNGDTVMGFCADHGGGMGWSLEGHEWNNPREITDPTVKTMMAYFYAHSRGIFTDQAKALGVDETWSSDYTWTMNAWVQAVVWRYQENLFSDPVAACAEELMYVYNNLEHTSYSSIDDVVDGTTLRDRAQYILDLGAQGVWGDCTVYEYDYAGPGTAQHPAYDVQGIIIGDLTVTRERYQFTIKKVDATNPNLALPGARFLVQNANGTFEKEVVTGRDGTVTLTNLEASTYSVTELDPPEDYQIDNPGPQYVVLPDSNGETVVVTFTDTPIITSEGSIRKVDADDPTKGLAGAVIKIEGVDNEFTGTYITGAGGYLEDVPWDAMPIGSFVATELTPPNGYTTSSDPDKVRQEFYWDGKHDVDLIFENDAKVKVQLIKLDDSDNPIEGAVFNVVKDGQVIATEATDADGSIIVPNVTEGMYAFFEVSVPAPYAKLQQPVIAHVDQATVDGGGTVTVTAVDQMLPTLTILKRDGQTGEVVPGAVFEVKGIHHGYHTDVTTGPDGTAALTGLPVDSYEVTEISVPDPYVVAAEPTQTIWLGPGDNRQLIFDNLKQPQLTIAIVIDDLEPGTTITAREVKTLEGYVLDTAPKSIEIKSGEVQTLRFYNSKQGTLVIRKLDSVTKEPLAGVEFELTYADGGYVDDANGHLSSLGLYTTDQNGEIRISGVTGTIVVKVTKTISGYTIDPATQTQTVEVNPEDTLMAQILTDVIISNTKGDEKGDHFWDNGESNLLKSLILYVDLDSTRTPEERNLAAVYQMLTQHTEKQLTMLFDRLPIGHPAKGPYSLFSQASDTVRAGIVLGLGTRLQVLQSEAVRRITRSSDIDLSEPGWNKCAYFIILDDQNSSLEFLSALFFAFLFIKLVRYADSTPEQRCKIPVNIILDEMNNIGSIKDFGRRLSTIRSRMLQILMCSQSLPQLQNRYPNNLWAELLGNADTQILLGATDDVTAEYFSARSGDMTVEVNSTMTTRQSLALAQVIPQYRYTEGIGRRRVLTPDEVLRLPNDELLIIIRGQKVLRAKKFDFTEHPYAKECERTSIQQYHSEQVPTQPQEALDQSIPPKPSVTELPGQAPAASEKPPAKPKASPAKPQAPAPKTPPSGDQPSELPSKPAKRPKTLYESSRPPADF